MKAITTTLIALILFTLSGCSESTEERQARLDHQYRMAVIDSHRQAREPDHYVRESSFAENMAMAAAAGYVFSAFQPRYEPSYRGGVYYDRHNTVISKTVYETRIKTVEVDKKKYNKKKKSDFKKWKSNPKNAKKFNSKKLASKKAKKAEKKAKQKTGSKVAASKKWAGSDRSNKSHWNAAKGSKKPAKSNSYKTKSQKSSSSYKSSSYKSSSSRPRYSSRSSSNRR